ncbi:hypothetical protein DQ237_12185 [Blastococcus sp. TF02-8]|uniref:hypothetical protein n=1 Tax=Blastococcus sp. TF02-8 TaxID=2250574 RepID=UPI000DFA6BED|nr:hypothetical protein [Blastococcus sp. TF02-8]RBY95892.1 hypothetical protein DQ237_12185 [Blastococcus sp. TF02-8]
MNDRQLAELAGHASEREWMTMLAQRDVDVALRPVGMTASDVLALGGSVLEGGEPYLVGSLASGVGNAGSDVDVHMFSDKVEEVSPSILFFHGDTPVDIEQFPTGLLAAVREAAASFPVAETPVGTVTAAGAPPSPMRSVWSRWLTAVPLRRGAPELLDDDTGKVIAGSLVRAALEDLLLNLAVAWLAAESAAASEDTRAYLWRRAARSLVEARCRAAGGFATGDKWLPAQCRRVALDAEFVRSAYTARTSRDVDLLLDETGLGRVDPGLAVLVSPDPTAQVVSVGRESYLLSAHKMLSPTWPDVSGSLEKCLSATSADRLLEGLRMRHLTLTADTAATNLWLGVTA